MYVTSTFLLIFKSEHPVSLWELISTNHCEISLFAKEERIAKVSIFGAKRVSSDESVLGLMKGTRRLKTANGCAGEWQKRKLPSRNRTVPEPCVPLQTFACDKTLSSMFKARSYYDLSFCFGTNNLLHTPLLGEAIGLPDQCFD